MNKRPLTVLGILILGVGVAALLVKTAPKAKKKDTEVGVPLVEVAPLVAGNFRAKWTGGATVNSNASVNLVPQVAGQIISISGDALPGGFLKKGHVLAQIDSRSFQLIVDQRNAAFIQAKANLDIEKGQVQKAMADYRLSGMQLSKDAKSLALREPQLASAQAAMNSAKAALDQAKLDLSRTRITMPFDGYVVSRQLSTGAYVNNTTPLFNVIEANEFWLELKVPQSFVDVLDNDHPVEISKLKSNQTRTGRILGVLPQVDAQDRQVRVLVAIEDPLSSVPVIRYNDFVKITLSSREFENVYEIPTQYVNTDMETWVVDGKNSLQKRLGNVIYQGREKTWIEMNSESADQLLLSNLSLQVPGQTVRVLGNKNTPTDLEIPQASAADIAIEGGQ